MNIELRLGLARLMCFTAEGPEMIDLTFKEGIDTARLELRHFPAL